MSIWALAEVRECLEVLETWRASSKAANIPPSLILPCGCRLGASAPRLSMPASVCAEAPPLRHSRLLSVPRFHRPNSGLLYFLFRRQNHIRVVKFHEEG